MRLDQTHAVATVKNPHRNVPGERLRLTDRRPSARVDLAHNPISGASDRVGRTREPLPRARRPHHRIINLGDGVTEHFQRRARAPRVHRVWLGVELLGLLGGDDRVAIVADAGHQVAGAGGEHVPYGVAHKHRQPVIARDPAGRHRGGRLVVGADPHAAHSNAVRVRLAGDPPEVRPGLALESEPGGAGVRSHFRQRGVPVDVRPQRADLRLRVIEPLGQNRQPLLGGGRSHCHLLSRAFSASRRAFGPSSLHPRRPGQQLRPALRLRCRWAQNPSRRPCRSCAW